MLGNYQKLYLHQFFSNYFIKKQQHEEISLLKSSLEVLMELASSFVKSHDIDIKDRFHNKESQNTNLQQLFEELYFVIKTIFNWIDNERVFEENNHKDEYNSTISQNAYNLGASDNELYGILNEYKINNKKLKAENEQLRKKVSKYQRQYSELEDEFKQASTEYCAKIESLQQDSQNFLQRIKLLNTEIQNRNIQNQQITQKLHKKQEQAFVKQQKNNDLSLIIQQLNNKLSNLQNQLEQLRKQHAKTKKMSSQQIQALIEKIPMMVDQQLKNKQNWNAPVYHTLAKFVKNLQKPIKIENSKQSIPNSNGNES